MVTQQRVTDALEKVSEIHHHLARGEVYRGFRPVATAVTGMVGVTAAGLQPHVVGRGDLWGFLYFWTGVAAVNVFLHGVAIMRNYAADSDLARRRTVNVLGQFLPALTAGALLTGSVVLVGEQVIPLLPGVWALLFSLALFSARPYLPRRIGWVALFYFVCGAVLLSSIDKSIFFLGMAMGAIFGIGQIGAAAVLYRDEERRA